MKTSQFVFSFLILLSVIVAPVLAEPAAHRWTWNWYGTTQLAGYNDPSLTEVVGSNIQLVGTAFNTSDPGPWKGNGVFSDESLNLKAVLHIQGGIYGPADDTSFVFGPYGMADVIVGDVRQGSYPFAIYVIGSDSEHWGGLNFGLSNYPNEGHSTSWTLGELHGRGLRYN